MIEPSSSSTAVSPTPSAPSSPALSRRMSWNRPRPPDQGSPTDNGPETASTSRDPFRRYQGDDSPFTGGRDIPSLTYGYDEPGTTPSIASMERIERVDSPSAFAFDDVRLTSREGDHDPERVHVASRYDDMHASPLKKGGDALMSVSRRIRRVSVRVVNLGGVDRGVRLDDPPDGDIPRAGMNGEDGEEKYHPDDGRPAQPTTVEAKLGPLRGRTLGFLHPTSRLRLSMYNLLIYKWTEPGILLLIILNTLVLTIQAAKSLFSTDPYPTSVLSSWENVTLFVLFVVFSLECLARMTVSGLILDPEVPLSALFIEPFRQSPLTFSSFATQVRSALSLTQSGHATNPVSTSLSLKRTTQHLRQQSSSIGLPKYLPFEVAFHVQRSLARRGVPYLRHSWSRVDFIAVSSFWVHFALALVGTERTASLHIGIFRALSVLRASRLLAVTRGTTTILQSLKVARPLLANVAFFVIFAMILFSIVGIQSFKGSFLRQCTLPLNDGTGTNITWGQCCGGFIDPTFLNHSSFIMQNGEVSTSLPRGYICPLGQVCQEQTQNPESGLQSYDNIFAALLQVVIIASVNTWAPIMYDMIDAEFFVSCIFYIFGIIILNFWLINLFVAVITTTFSGIRAKTNKSAFGGKMEGGFDMAAEGKADDARMRRGGLVMRAYEKSKFFWVLVIVASVGLQASQTPSRSASYRSFLSVFELIVTFVFDVEILWRFLAYTPDWRLFWNRPANFLDLTLAVLCSITQLPGIRSSFVAPWLTVFQLARFYRVIIAFPRMKPLLVAVFGNLSGLMNMIVFLLLTVFLSALVSVQLIRGDMQSDTNMNFAQIFNGFLAMYQVFSSENWTTVLYNVGQDEAPLRQSIITTIFICAWMVFANFIILQMFVAVLHENIEVAEETRGKEEAERNRSSVQPVQRRRKLSLALQRWNPFSLGGELPIHPVQKMSLDDDPPLFTGPSRPQVERSWSGGTEAASFRQSSFQRYPGSNTVTSSTRYATIHSTVSVLNKFFGGEAIPDDVPLMDLNRTRSGFTGFLHRENLDRVERHLEILASLKHEKEGVRESDKAREEDRRRKAAYLARHPSYDRSLWLFDQGNPLRVWCQKLIRPKGGERYFGAPHSFYAFAAFQLVLLAAVVAGIVIAGIATPLYRHKRVASQSSGTLPWYDIAESAFALTLVVEFLIKIVADGFVFSPNAYLNDIWNVIDFFIMLGLVVNVITTLVVVGGVNRLTRSLTALRALRLITLIDNNRTTFQSLVFAGIVRILDAVLLALLYLIPYAVWGLNIFQGLMFSCNDTSASSKDGCKNEFINNVLDNQNLGYYAPRVWDNPHTSTSWSFDDFPSSLLILFEIVSLEGWIDVLSAAVGITGKDAQPVVNANQANALFFLIFNLLGAVVILTIFVSIIIGNFSRKKGTAYHTQKQKDWINLRKVLIRQRPSRRPKNRPRSFLRGWCYDRAVTKHGWWSQMTTALFILHILVLMTQTFSVSTIDDTLRDDFFLLVTCLYAVDILVRFYGLGFSFLAGGWNLFDLLAVTGSFATTIPLRLGSTGFATQQLQKLFLVVIAFKIVQRSNRLNQLFKTARSSIPDILNLLGLWFTLFVFFAILCLEVFGLTRWESAETHEQNFSSLGRSLVMLAFMSTGEGWNQYMHDFAVTYPRCTNSTPTNSTSDCGSTGWAFTLFIAWNVLSMYIFVNMFTGVVVDSFSYVTQTSGGATTVGREEVRGFKKTWAEYSDPRTGLLMPDKFTAFFANLKGIFEVRIYPIESSVPYLLAASRASHDPDHPPSKQMGDIDLGKLQQALNAIDVATIRKRRAVYVRVMQEAEYHTRSHAGLTFTDALLLIARNKFVEDDHAFTRDERESFKFSKGEIDNYADLERVRGLLATIHERHRFLEYRATRYSQSHRDIPAIVVDGFSITPAPHSPSWDSVHDNPTSDFLADYLSDGDSVLPPPHSRSPSSQLQVSTNLDPNLASRGIQLVISDGRLSPGRSNPTSPTQGDFPPSSPSSNSKWGEIMRRVSVRIADSPQHSPRYSTDNASL